MPLCMGLSHNGVIKNNNCELQMNINVLVDLHCWLHHDYTICVYSHTAPCCCTLVYKIKSIINRNRLNVAMLHVHYMLGRNKGLLHCIFCHVPDCTEVGETVTHHGSGQYLVKPDHSERSERVRCEFDEAGSWTVIQHRVDGAESFDRTWREYRYLFCITISQIVTDFI